MRSIQPIPIYVAIIAIVSMVCFAIGLNVAESGSYISPSEVFRNYLLGVGVLGGAYGLYLATIRTSSTKVQTETQARDAATRDRSETRRHVTETFARAVELLARDSEHFQLGAIHTLGRLTHDDPNSFEQVAAVLSSFVRQSCPMIVGKDGNNILLATRDIPPANLAVCAAIDTLADLDRNDHSRLSAIDLSNICLSSVLVRDGNLDGANFDGSRFYNVEFYSTSMIKVDFLNMSIENCVFEDCTMKETRLIGGNISDSRFAECDLSFSGIDTQLNAFPIPQTIFINCTLRGAVVRRGFLEHVRDCDLTEAVYGDRPKGLLDEPEFVVAPKK